MHEDGGGTRVKEILVGVVRFVALSIALLFIQHAISDTKPVEGIKNAAYSLLQLRLASSSDPANDVVVVDINDLPKSEREDLPKQDAPTSRSDLLKLLNRVADSGAAAIGIDIDFSPEDDGNYVLPDDPDFFSDVQTLSRSKRVPIFLGVWRQSARGTENWLADSKFASLAAGLPVPKENTKHMPVYIEAGEGQLPLQTMAAALASTKAKLRERPPSWSLGLLEYRLEKTPQPGLNIEEIAVDYSQLENLVSDRIGWRSMMTINDPNRLKGKLVLIGDASPMVSQDNADLFQVPGRLGQYAGVFLHGSAAYSALKAPLYEFKEGADERLDIIVGAVLLTLVVSFQILLRKDPDRHPKSARYTAIAYYLTATSMLIFGVWFVNVTRTMWDDFPIFIAALLIHHWSETLIERRVERHHDHHDSHAEETVEKLEALELAPSEHPLAADPGSSEG